MTLKNTYGFFTIFALALILILGLFGVTAVSLFINTTESSTALQKTTQAFYIANMGLQAYTKKLTDATLSSRITCSGSATVTGTKGVATVTLTSIYVSSPTALNGALTSTATTITVSSTTNYSSTGRLVIDTEAIDYQGKDSTHFYNAVRGVGGTIALSHLSGADVTQYQCEVSSLGRVPSAASPLASQQVYQEVPLQKGWVVGNDNLTTAGIWNDTADPNDWDIISSPQSAREMYAISMINYNDGWAMGERHDSAKQLFLHWTGSSWQSSMVNMSNPRDVYGIACTGSDNCFAVGLEVSSSSAYILRWNGSSWSNTFVSLGTTQNLRGIACPSASECWAVGDNDGSDIYIIRWNGSAWSDASVSSGSATDLNGVACVTTGECWAVGDKLGASSPFIMKLVGTTWSLVSVTISGAQNLRSVACAGSGDCWAVGNPNNHRPVIYRLVGNTWSNYSHSLAYDDTLFTVKCFNSDDCWAGGQQGALLHWDGTSWTQPSSPFLNVIRAIGVVGGDADPRAGWRQ